MNTKNRRKIWKNSKQSELGDMINSRQNYLHLTQVVLESILRCLKLMKPIQWIIFVWSLTVL